MKFKKITAAFSLALLLSSYHVSAAQGVSEKHIPKYMDPGTTITFDKDNNVITLNKGEKTEFSKNHPINIDESKLPMAKEGLTVTYDALGQPIVINKAVRENPKIKVDVKKVDTTTLTTSAATSTSVNTQIGKTTWYWASGKKGESGVTLDEWSASHMTIPFWTTVHVVDRNNATKGATVYVLDRGNFSKPVVLDIDHKRFVNSFYPDTVGWFDSKLTWYS